MIDEFTIQCQSCGTYYNELQEVCPYCGQPQPAIEESHLPVDDGLPPAAIIDDEPEEYYLEDELLPETHGLDESEIYLPEEELPAEEDPFVDDDIFVVAGADIPADAGLDEPDPPDEFEDSLYAETDPYYDPDLEAEPEPYPEPYSSTDEEEPAPEQAPRRFTFRRLLVGCLGLLACFGLFYGGIGLVAVREGLQERAYNHQIESQQHYQRGRDYLAADSVELAIAEFERALSLNPNFTEARQALREAQRIAQTQPTPTSQTRSAAVADFLSQAEAHISGQNWGSAIETLLRVRDLDPEYNPTQVSDLLFTAYWERGLQLRNPEQINEALSAFELALAERPDDPAATTEQQKAALYLNGVAAADNDPRQAIELFSELRRVDENYLDTSQYLWRAHEKFGDSLAESGEWCRAEVQFTEAYSLQASQALQAKAENAGERCQGTNASPRPTATPTAAAPSSGSNSAAAGSSPTEEATPTPQAAAAARSQGTIYYSTFNFNETRWEVVAVPAAGGAANLVVTHATMPAISANGQLLLYHAELIDAEGLHIYNLTSGEDRRITPFKAHILPRWGGDNQQFIFSSQEPGTGRWLIYQGFADGKGDPVILQDGRTPDWSSSLGLIAYQGTDAEGNNPGIYTVPLGGGTPTRLTTHPSDRSPVFSPDGSQLAYMSTQNGSWDIYLVSTTAGGSPQQLTSTTGNAGLPAWSPDGRQLAYVSDADGSWAIYVVDSRGSPPTKIAEWDGSNRSDWLQAQIWWGP